MVSVMVSVAAEPRHIYSALSAVLQETGGDQL